MIEQSASILLNNKTHYSLTIINSQTSTSSRFRMQEQVAPKQVNQISAATEEPQVGEVDAERPVEGGMKDSALTQLRTVILRMSA
jgi:hypothetical protein